VSPLAAFGDRINAWPGAARAAFWMLILGALVTLVLALVRKTAAGGVHVFEIVFFRSLFGLVFMGPWLARKGLSALRVQVPGLIALRGFLAFVGAAAMFLAATMMPLADITAITFTRPILAAIAAVIFLGEVVRARRWSAIVVGIVGALVIVRPGMSGVNAGVVFVLLTVAAQTWNVINLKKLTNVEHPDTIAVYHAISILPMSLAVAVFFWVWPSWEQLGLMFAIGVLEMLAQRVMSRAYAAADTTVVLAFSFTRLPVAALLGFLLFGEVPEIWVWIGGAIITASSVYIAQRESVSRAARKKTGGGRV
jgi:drug/metabolite transporter (DMT)-like permease